MEKTPQVLLEEKTKRTFDAIKLKKPWKGRSKSEEGGGRKV